MWLKLYRILIFFWLKIPRGASSQIINIPLVNEYDDLIDVSKRYYKYEQEIIEIENMLIKLSNSKRFPKIIKKVKEILYE